MALYPYGTQILIRSSSTDKTDNYCVVWLNYTQAVDCGDLSAWTLEATALV